MPSTGTALSRGRARGPPTEEQSRAAAEGATHSWRTTISGSPQSTSPSARGILLTPSLILLLTYLQADRLVFIRCRASGRAAPQRKSSKKHSARSLQTGRHYLLPFCLPTNSHSLSPLLHPPTRCTRCRSSHCPTTTSAVSLGHCRKTKF